MFEDDFIKTYSSTVNSDYSVIKEKLKEMLKAKETLDVSSMYPAFDDSIDSRVIAIDTDEFYNTPYIDTDMARSAYNSNKENVLENIEKLSKELDEILKK